MLASELRCQSVINMEFMFSGASAFNDGTSNWDVSQVTNVHDYVL